MLPEPGYPRRVASQAASVVVAAVLLPGCGVAFPLVAPLFDHGSGVAGYGCIVTASPVFLSESEAQDIILDELHALGWTEVSDEGHCAAWSGDRVAHRDSLIEVLDGVTVTDRLDLCGGGVGVEFFSERDFERMVLSLEPTSSVVSMDHKSIADHARLSMAASLPPGAPRHVGVIYDPVEDDWRSSQYEPTGREQAEAEVRAQVRDFDTWLRVRREP